MRSFTRLEKIVILIIALLVTFIIGSKILSNNDKNDIQIEENGLFLEDENNDEEDENELFADDGGKEDEPTHVVVHITGAVSKPGVVTLKNGDRVIDAIKKAGGLKSSADENRINLAQKLFDEDKVIIPTLGDDLELEHASLDPSNLEREDSQSMVISGSGENNSSSSDSNSSGGGSININTASKSELETLPGIGDVTSQKIIDYRESTKFGSVEDIKNVSGIGEKKFEAIQSMITTK